LLPDAKLSFTWKGVAAASAAYEHLMQDIRNAGLQQVVELAPANADMASFYASIDLFLLTSREDPYPLVVLEAASYGKPTICFEGAGGAVEFVAHDAGTVVPFVSVEEMAQAIARYYRNRTILYSQGSNARQAVKDLHQNETYLMNQFTEAIKQVVEHL
jgi:glycosyltransferase involved in cell wall biosynthesis